jgi:hypothetical protein
MAPFSCLFFHVQSQDDNYFKKEVGDGLVLCEFVLLCYYCLKEILNLQSGLSLAG